jgi:hypothetical protein
MSKIEVNTIDAVSGTSTLTLGSSNASTIALGSGDVQSNFLNPAFQANTVADATISIANATLTKVTFGTEVLDSDSKFADSRFTPTIAGKYFIYTRLSFSTSIDFDDLRLHFYKNGSRYSGAVGRNEYFQQIYLYDIIDFDADDYVEVYAYHDGTGGSRNILTNEDGRRNCFGGYRIGT